MKHFICLRLFFRSFCRHTKTPPFPYPFFYIFSFHNPFLFVNRQAPEGLHAFIQILLVARKNQRLYRAPRHRIHTQRRTRHRAFLLFSGRGILTLVEKPPDPLGLCVYSLCSHLNTAKIINLCILCKYLAKKINESILFNISPHQLFVLQILKPIPELYTTKTIRN